MIFMRQIQLHFETYTDGIDPFTAGSTGLKCWVIDPLKRQPIAATYLSLHFHAGSGGASGTMKHLVFENAEDGCQSHDNMTVLTNDKDRPLEKATPVNLFRVTAADRGFDMTKILRTTFPSKSPSDKRGFEMDGNI